jgi:ornithine carbamoyltransferase
MTDAVKQFNTGMGQDERLQLARAAIAVGVRKDVAAKIADGDPAAMQIFHKHSVQMAFEAARQQMGGVPRSVQEIQYQLAANPSLGLEPRANKVIMDYMDAVSAFQEQKQRSKDQWLADHNNSLRGFEGNFNNTHDINDFNKSFDAAHPTTGRTSGGIIGNNGSANSAAQKTVVRYGTDSNGKRVAQFSDGTIGPAQ